MTGLCDYCRGACEEGAIKCKNCGAPVDEGEVDYRSCPYCRKKLLALGSPACNYCGRRLPGSYIKAHQAARRRIEELESEPVVADQNIANILAGMSRPENDRSSISDLIGGLLNLTDL
jgi:hypothetical protein